MLLYPLCCSPDVPVATTKGLHTGNLTPEILMAGKLSFFWMVILQGKLRECILASPTPSLQDPKTLKIPWERLRLAFGMQILVHSLNTLDLHRR